MDQEKENPPKRNLISIFKNYYKLGIHHFIGNSGHAIFTGLLYKFNEMGFPDELKISSQEICTISALDIRTFRSAIKLLVEYRHYDGDPDSWIVKYEFNVKEYGIYSLNFTFMLQLCSNFATTLPQKNGDAPISKPRKARMSAKNARPSNTILDHTIQDPFSLDPGTSIVHSKEVAIVEKEKKDYYDPLGKEEQTQEEIEESENDAVYEERFQSIKELFKNSCTGFELGGKPRVVAFRNILEYPDEKIGTVVERAGEYGTDSAHILSWVRKGLEDYDRLYKNSDYQDARPMYKEFEPMDDEHRSQLIEGLERKRLRDIDEYKKHQEEQS